MNKYFRFALYAVIGGVLGYSWYYFIGCANGSSCPLTSRWYITTIYGFVSGILVALPSRNSAKSKEP